METIGSGKTIFVVRHAQREDNINNRWNEKYPDFLSDNSPLSDKGRSQAHDLKKFFKDIPIHAVYSSPYDRTMETASILSQDHSLNVKVEPGLAELLLICEEPPGFWPNDRLKTKFERVYDEYEPVFTVPLPKEGYDCTPRLTQTILKIMERHGSSDNIVVVSHQCAIDSIFMGLGCGSAYVGHATISVFNEDEPDSNNFTCTHKSLKTHLGKDNRKNLDGC